MSAVPLEEALAESRFGGKASALARAIVAGLPVPGGFALSSDLVARIASGDPESQAAALAFFENSRRPVAVRSSGIGEDSADASFAGQHATILNVTTAHAFLDAVRAVHDSSRNDAAAGYRERLGISGPARTGVVVQRMVRPDTAGVLFTRNPISGADERVIEASWGLGEAVVAGLVVPDRFRLARGGGVIERIAGVKDVEIVMLDGGATEEVPIDDEKARRLTLSDAQLVALDRLASLCEETFGGPQDLEWAFEGDELHLLQSRPITRGGSDAARPAVAPTQEVESYELSAGRFAGLALAAILSPLNSTSIAVALPAIGTSLSADAASVTRWLVTSYLIVSIIAQSPGGKLSDAWGYSRVLTWGRILFGVGALVSSFAPHLVVLGIGRIVMAVGGALTIPTVMAELRNNTPPHRRGRLFGLFGAIMGTAAGIGPLVGGVLITHFGWHSIFIINLPVVALSLILEPPHRDPTRERKASFDLLGAFLFGAGILAILAGLQKPLHPLLAITGAAIIGIFVVRESRADDPMLDVHLFTLRPFAAGSSIVALQNLAMYATLFLLPFLLAREPASATGSAMMAMIVAMVLASPVGGRLTDWIGARATAVAGGLVAFSGALLLYTTRVGFTQHTIGALVLLGLGLGLSTSPSQAAALSAVPREKAGMASGAMSTMRYLGGVAGSAIIAALLAESGWRSQWFAWIFPPVLLISAFVALLLPASEGAAARRD